MATESGAGPGAGAGRSVLPLLPPLVQLLPLLLLLSSCSYQEVVFHGVKGVNVGNMDGDGLALNVMVSLENPNKFRIHLIDPSVDIFLNDVPIGKATLDSHLVLDKDTLKEYAVPIHTVFDSQGQAMGAMLAAALSGEARLKAKGSIVGRAFLFRKRFPFEEEELIEMER